MARKCAIELSCVRRGARTESVAQQGSSTRFPSSTSPRREKRTSPELSSATPEPLRARARPPPHSSYNLDCCEKSTTSRVLSNHSLSASLASSSYLTCCSFSNSACARRNCTVTSSRNSWPPSVGDAREGTPGLLTRSRHQTLLAVPDHTRDIDLPAGEGDPLCNMTRSTCFSVQAVLCRCRVSRHTRKRCTLRPSLPRGSLVSTNCCSFKDTKLPVLREHAPSCEPVVEKTACTQTVLDLSRETETRRDIIIPRWTQYSFGTEVHKFPAKLYSQLQIGLRLGTSRFVNT